MNSLHILSVAYPFAAVDEHSAGGAEQILKELDAGISAAGHRSTVIAARGSQVAGRLIEVEVPSGVVTNGVRGRVWQSVRNTIQQTLEAEDVDLLHFHGCDFYEYLPDANTPALVTLHLPPEWYPANVFDGLRPNLHFNCVSRSQRAKCRIPADTVAVVENGVRCPSLITHGKVGSFALALGRICPEKNLHVALTVGKLAGISVFLAGQVFPFADHRRYFEEKILPNLDAHRIFIGPIGGAHKWQLLAEAECVLIPTLAPETSSLVAMEALAAGTPVIAYASGALTEIIEHGKTGFLVRSESEMAEAIGHAREIDPRACREVARTRFSARRMVENYLKLYDEICYSRAPLPRAAAAASAQAKPSGAPYA